jgi:translation initiation factor IF-2
MPVRIYDIAKKLGIESKSVLAKAKALGITAAKVPSSSLDKITAEYLENEIRVTLPQAEPPPIVLEQPPLAESPPEPAPVPDLPTPPPEVEIPPTPPIIAAPLPIESPEETPAEATPLPPPLVQEPVQVEAKADFAAEPAAPPPVEEIPEVPEPSLMSPPVESAPPPPVPAPPPEAEQAAPPQSEQPAATPAPPPPPAPRIGDKVGFIKLPPKPVRGQDRSAPPKPPPTKPGRTEAPRGRPEFRDNRPAHPSQGRQSQSGQGRQFQPQRQESHSRPAPPPEPKYVPPLTGELITLKPPIIVRDLAEQLKKKPFQLIADLMHENVFASVNQAIDEVVAQKLCAKYGYRFELEKRERGAGVIHGPVKKVELDVDDKPDELKTRAPVVTIMGHVDHGKTTLLDVIRRSNVAAGEAGGITQHIGAYTISIPHPERPNDLQQITFLDTPGHAAFSSMRARGANVTDIVVLVVAANDGVMPQTLEALSHAQAAKVPILVAVNKCDHPAANPMKVRQQLQDKGLVPDEWGGETIFVDVSALTKQGVDKLLEMLVLQADLLELKANPNRRAKGNVIESGLEPGGPTATVLIRKGTLRVLDAVICGQFWGRVRALINEEGKRLKEAGPSVAVKLLGLNGIPEAGLEFSAVDNEKSARALAEERAQQNRLTDKERRPKITIDTLWATLASESSKVLPLVVKADTQGSVEAIVDGLKKIESTKVSLDLIHSAVGTITESDVLLASASKAIILGFHTRLDNGVAEVAKREGVQIKLYAIIYELIDQIKEAMAGLLDPLVKEVVVGSAEVRKVFALSKGGNVAGCMVSSGRIVKGKMRVMRRKNLVFEGLSQSLRRFQDEVNEVRAGMECGIRLDGFDDFQPGDAIECYTLEKTPQKL